MIFRAAGESKNYLWFSIKALQFYVSFIRLPYLDNTVGSSSQQVVAAVLLQGQQPEGAHGHHLHVGIQLFLQKTQKTIKIQYSFLKSSIYNYHLGRISKYPCSLSLVTHTYELPKHHFLPLFSPHLHYFILLTYTCALSFFFFFNMSHYFVFLFRPPSPPSNNFGAKSSSREETYFL